MRLTTEEAQAIRDSVAEVFGAAAQVWLFGSRVDDRRRGGDIDLLVRPPVGRATDPETAWRDKLCLLGQLERRLGERKIDVVLEAPDDPRPIVRIAHQTGIPL
jgi:predicted nucleotidyltransferase